MDDEKKEIETVEEKTFTQEQVNNLIKKETAKSIEKLVKELGVDSFENAKDGLTKLKELKESEKTELEKLQDRIKELEEGNNSTVQKLTIKDHQLELLKAGVPGDKLETYTKLLGTYDGDDIAVKMESVLKDFPLNVAPVENTEKPSSLGGEVGKGSEVKTAEQESADLDAVFGIV